MFLVSVGHGLLWNTTHVCFVLCMMNHFIVNLEPYPSNPCYGAVERKLEKPEVNLAEALIAQNRQKCAQTFPELFS